MQPTRGVVRALRAGILGAVTLLLAVTAHLIGGGDLPSIGILAAAAVGVAGVTSTMTARRLGRVPLLIMVGALQLLLHLVLAATTALGVCAPVATVHPGHGSGVSCTTGMTAMAMSGHSPTMLIGHLVATLATAWLLARGEAFVWALADHAIRAAWRRRPWTAPGPARTATWWPSRLPTARLLAGPTAPRGPPALIG